VAAIFEDASADGGIIEICEAEGGLLIAISDEFEGCTFLASRTNIIGLRAALAAWLAKTRWSKET
jgi:hypothetical protein